MAKKSIITGFIASLLFVSLIAYSLPAFAQGPELTPAKSEVIAVSGITPKKDMIVHVLVLVQPGADRNEAAVAALAQQGARPFTSDEFSTMALYWDQFGDNDPGNDKVIQNYNPKNDPANGAGFIALTNTHTTWNNVSSSSFTFEYGEDTRRCPSLVKECRGDQTFDGNNDVAWLKLNSPTILAVTWSGTYIDEADIALNTDFNWETDGVNHFDVETVFLHENGHVLGLGHSIDFSAIMFPSYQKVNRDLQQDDIAGVSFLYPATNNTEPDPEPTPVVSSVKQIVYGLAGGKNNDKHLLVTIHVVADESDLSGVDVSISLSNDKFRKGWSGSGTTEGDGTVTFQLNNARSGCYTTILNSVTSDPSWDRTQPQDVGYCKP
ncbi:MAG: matrixin family metalloprotease [Thaumarchaeota archaeon]|nr:matrixin family metalloprotease [Nitrososphaerota archaeon]